MDIYFDNLNNEQAHGHKCVVCPTDFRYSGVAAAPVGFSATTGSQVFACAEPCAPAVGYVPPVGEQPALDGGR